MEMNLRATSGGEGGGSQNRAPKTMKIQQKKTNTLKCDRWKILAFLAITIIITMSFGFIVERKIRSERTAVKLTHTMISMNDTIGNLGTKIDELDMQMAETSSAMAALAVDLEKIRKSNKAIRDMTLYLTASYNVLDNAYHKLCDVRYSGDCFWFSIHPTADINLTQAEEICDGRGSTLCNVHDRIHYDMLLQYLRTHAPNGSTYVSAWTGLAINTTTNHVTFGGNKPAPYTNWPPGYPLNDSDKTAISLRARQDSDALDQGMYNDPPFSVRFGVVCMLRAPTSWLSDFPSFTMKQFGWFQASNKYWYKLYKPAATYENAKEKCASVGAALISKGMRDPIVRSEIQSTLRTLDVNIVWIGLDDLVKQGSYMWLDGVPSTAVDANWNTGEPNFPDERCVHIEKGNEWKTTDNDCSREFAYLCEMAL